jgi:hypothetical protein
MNDDETEDRQWWRDLVTDLYLACCGVALCVLVSGLLGAAYFYWVMK